MVRVHVATPATVLDTAAGASSQRVLITPASREWGVKTRTLASAADRALKVGGAISEGEGHVRKDVSFLYVINLHLSHARLTLLVQIDIKP